MTGGKWLGDAIDYGRAMLALTRQFVAERICSGYGGEVKRGERRLPRGASAVPPAQQPRFDEGGGAIECKVDHAEDHRAEHHKVHLEASAAGDDETADAVAGGSLKSVLADGNQLVSLIAMMRSQGCRHLQVMEVPAIAPNLGESASKMYSPWTSCTDSSW